MQDKKLSFLELAIKAMEEFKQPATPSELWSFVLERNLHYNLDTFDINTKTFSGKTPKESFCGIIYGDNSVHFTYEAGTKPKKYILKASQETAMLPKSVVLTHRKKSLFNERDLHQVLSNFLYKSEYFHAYSKTIFHEESSKRQKGEDKWLYPDMVAVNFEYANYQHENVRAFIERFSRLPLKIFSFELKKELNYSNYKKYFFQAVSNSSWANEGYLVALDIEHNNQFIESLQKLSQSFGIGIIQLNLKQIEKSTMLSPAKFKEEMDYSVVNELAHKNNNFAQFLKTVIDFDVQNPNRFKNEFDIILPDDKLNQYLLDKHIVG